MKKLFLIVILFSVFAAFAQDVVINTNTDATIESVITEIQDVKFIVGQWGDFAQIVKSSGFTLAIVPTLIFLIICSLVIIGVVVNIILNFIEIFTPPAVDEKLNKIEKWIETYLIKYSYVVLKKLKTIVKKK